MTCLGRRLRNLIGEAIHTTMIARAASTGIRTPLLLLAVVEAAVLYSSIYVAALICFGTQDSSVPKQIRAAT